MVADCEVSANCDAVVKLSEKVMVFSVVINRVSEDADMVSKLEVAVRVSDMVVVSSKFAVVDSSETV